MNITSSPPNQQFEFQAWDGFESYVIARLPQLERLDGKEITRTVRIRAEQRLPACCAELPTLAEEVRKTFLPASRVSCLATGMLTLHQHAAAMVYNPGNPIMERTHHKEQLLPSGVFLFP